MATGSLASAATSAGICLRNSVKLSPANNKGQEIVNLSKLPSKLSSPGDLKCGTAASGLVPLRRRDANGQVYSGMTLRIAACASPDSATGEEQKVEMGNAEPREKTWDGKRRLIIWSREPNKGFIGRLNLWSSEPKKDPCKERAEELIQFIEQYEQWRPHFYLLRQDHGKNTCKDKETCESMKRRWVGAQEANVQLDTKLTCHKLETLLQEILPKTCRTETIMIMTESTKDDFGVFVKALTDTTVTFNKPRKRTKEGPPFVALLERKKEDGLWSQARQIQSNEWKLEELLGCYRDTEATSPTSTTRRSIQQ